MQSKTAFFLAVFLAASATAVTTSAEDEASFYMEPGEKASNVPLLQGGREYYLVLADAKAVALLERRGSEVLPVEDPNRVAEILAAYARAGFPSALLDAGGDPPAASLLTEQLRRMPSALRRRLFYLRDSELRELRLQRDALHKKFNLFREVNFGSVDADLAALEATLEEMRKAKSLDASEKFSARFLEAGGRVEGKLGAIAAVSDAYSSAAAAVANAERAVAVSRKRLGESEAVRRLERDLLSVESELTGIEADVSTAGEVDSERLGAVEEGARSIARQAAGLGPADSFWWQVSAVIFALGLAVALALLWRRGRKQEGAAESVGQAILRRIRQFEEKAEREQRKAE